MFTAELIEAVQGCAKGSYQEGLLTPYTKWSGADLKGKARRWGAGYRDSRWSLLCRVDAAVRTYGYRAYNDLCMINHRWQRRLVLVTPEGVAIDWCTRKPIRVKA